jgi:TolA-binding protein
VFEKYPRSDRAPNALYKLALSQRAQSRPAAARALLERLVREYPRADEAQLARDLLRTLR